MVEHRSRFFQLIHPVYVGLAYLFIYLPIIVLVMFSFNESEISVRWTGFSLKWYEKLLTSPEIVEAFRSSLFVASTATACSVVTGTLLVIASKWWKPPLLFSLFYANIILPDIVLAIGILSIFTFLNIPLGFGSLIVGHTLIGLGFVVPIVRARFIELDPVLTEASLDLGATHIQTMRKVIIPLLMPSLIASSLIVFTLSLDDFLISFFCAGPNIQTLSTFVYSYVRTSVDPSINALSTVMLAMSSLVVLVLCAFNIIDEVISHE